MKYIYLLNRNKKGVSEIIAYVLLISITLALSVMIYAWLKFYVSDEEVPKCNDGVNLVIRDFDCYSGKNLTISLQNKGRFTTGGFTIRVHNRTGADFGFYLLNDTAFEIKPGEELVTVADITKLGNLTYLEVQPFILGKDKSKISCNSDSSQEVVCV